MVADVLVGAARRDLLFVNPMDRGKPLLQGQRAVR